MQNEQAPRSVEISSALIALIPNIYDYLKIIDHAAQLGELSDLVRGTLQEMISDLEEKGDSRDHKAP